MEEAEAVVKEIEDKVARWQVLRVPTLFAWCLPNNKTAQPSHKKRETAHFSSSENDVVDEEEDEGAEQDGVITVMPRTHTPLREVVSAILFLYPQRTILVVVLMVAQAFFYNAIFFSYAIVLVGILYVRVPHSSL